MIKLYLRSLFVSLCLVLYCCFIVLCFVVLLCPTMRVCPEKGGSSPITIHHPRRDHERVTDGSIESDSFSTMTTRTFDMTKLETRGEERKSCYYTYTRLMIRTK